MKKSKADLEITLGASLWRISELENCLKEIIRNSHDIIAKKLCNKVLYANDSLEKSIDEKP